MKQWRDNFKKWTSYGISMGILLFWKEKLMKQSLSWFHIILSNTILFCWRSSILPWWIIRILVLSIKRIIKIKYCNGRHTGIILIYLIKEINMLKDKQQLRPNFKSYIISAASRWKRSKKLIPILNNLSKEKFRTMIKMIKISIVPTVNPPTFFTHLSDKSWKQQKQRSCISYYVLFVFAMSLMIWWTFHPKKRLCLMCM